MAKTLATVACPFCGSSADIRARGGVSRAMDMKCESCGQLPFQTKAGQARLRALLESVQTPEKQPEPEVPESGEEPEKKDSENGFLTLMG